MQDEVNEKVVSLAIKTSKLTAEVLQKAIKALLAKGKGQITKAPHGKINMRQLMKPGEKVSCVFYLPLCTQTGTGRRLRCKNCKRCYIVLRGSSISFRGTGGKFRRTACDSGVLPD